MRLGHARGPDGEPLLFGESRGRRVEAPGLTLDELLADPAALASTREDLERRLAAGEGGPAAEEALLPPVLRPGKIVAIGLNYLDHCREFGTEPPTSPIAFPKLTSSLCGHEGVVRWDPEVTAEVDWEVELAVIVGQRLSRATPDEAMAGVFGYTVLNDVTARDVQRSETQWLRAKGLDTFCPMGPVAVTADEVPDPQALALRSRVNGRTMQDSTTSEMIFSVAELLSGLSRSFAFEPGDVVATGTPLGVGAFRDPPVFLEDGDVMEMEIDGIGVLRNRCATGPAKEEAA